MQYSMQIWKLNGSMLGAIQHGVHIRTLELRYFYFDLISTYVVGHAKMILSLREKPPPLKVKLAL
jgi:hypothetical protein